MPEYYVKLMINSEDGFYQWYKRRELTKHRREVYPVYGMEVGDIVSELVEMYQPYSLELIVR